MLALGKLPRIIQHIFGRLLQQHIIIPLPRRIHIRIIIDRPKPTKRRKPMPPQHLPTHLNHLGREPRHDGFHGGAYGVHLGHDFVFGVEQVVQLLVPVVDELLAGEQHDQGLGEEGH